MEITFVVIVSQYCCSHLNCCLFRTILKLRKFLLSSRYDNHIVFAKIFITLAFNICYGRCSLHQNWYVSDNAYSKVAFILLFCFSYVCIFLLQKKRILSCLDAIRFDWQISIVNIWEKSSSSTCDFTGQLDFAEDAVSVIVTIHPSFTFKSFLP